MFRSLKKLLLVEDDEVIALYNKRMLETKGYQVLHVTNGEQAIETVLKKKAPIDLILMDIDLGMGPDGTETASIILQEIDIPVVFLSSHTEKEIVERTENITSYGYVVKNTGLTVLDASIKMALKLFLARCTEKRQKEHMHFQLECEKAMVRIQNEFLLAGEHELDSKIYFAQREICELLGTDRSALWQRIAGDKTDFLLTHLSTLDEIPPVPKAATIRMFFPWFAERLLKGEIVAVPDISKLPEEASLDRQNLLHYGDRSTLAIPIITANASITGVLSFAATTKSLDWDESLLAKGQIFANTLGLFLDLHKLKFSK